MVMVYAPLGSVPAVPVHRLLLYITAAHASCKRFFVGATRIVGAWCYAFMDIRVGERGVL